MDFTSSISETKSREGTSLDQSEEISALQKHVSFFDRNKDGIVYPFETYKGFRAIGCNILLSAILAIPMNVVFSGSTRPGKFPDLRFPVVVKNIKRGKHGSDSGTYDTEGRFVPSKFEEIFSKHAHSCPDLLTSNELNEMLKENRQLFDFAGWVLSFFEWKLLYFLFKDKNGFLKKDTVRGLFDGTLFEQMEKDRASSQKQT